MVAVQKDHLVPAGDTLHKAAQGAINLFAARTHCQVMFNMMSKGPPGSLLPSCFPLWGHQPWLPLNKRSAL